jgi:hypothetical protein
MLSENHRDLTVSTCRCRASHLVRLLTTSSFSTPAPALPSIPANVPTIEAREDSNCPAVGTQVKAELNTLFMTGNQGNDLARAAIRAVFHDCGSWDDTEGLTGSCDVSIVVDVTPDVQLTGLRTEVYKLLPERPRIWRQNTAHLLHIWSFLL